MRAVTTIALCAGVVVFPLGTNRESDIIGNVPPLGTG